LPESMLEEFIICLGAEGTGAIDDARVADQFGEQVREDLAPLGAAPEQVRLELGSAGYGAEATTVLVTIAAIFLVAKSIEDNLEAWPRLAGRLRQVLDMLRRKHGGFSVSEPAALLLALEELKDRRFIAGKVQLVDHTVLPVFNGTIQPPLLKDFRHQPDRIYLFTFRNDEQDVIVVCLRSSGQFEFITRLPTGNYMEYFGVVEKGED